MHDMRNETKKRIYIRQLPSIIAISKSALAMQLGFIFFHRLTSFRNQLLHSNTIDPQYHKYKYRPAPFSIPSGAAIKILPLKWSCRFISRHIRKQGHNRLSIQKTFTYSVSCIFYKPAKLLPSRNGFISLYKKNLCLFPSKIENDSHKFSLIFR